MAEFNEIKEKVFATLGNFADKTKELAGYAADRAKCAARIAKLTVEISGERDRIKKAYYEIGKLYYESHRDDPEGFFSQLCDEISIANETIREKESEISLLRTYVPEDDGCCDCGCCEPEDFCQPEDEAEAEAEAETEAPVEDAPAEAPAEEKTAE